MCILRIVLPLLFAAGCAVWLHRRDARAMAGRGLDPVIDGLPAGVTAVGYGLLVAATGRPMLSGLCMAGGAGLLFVLNRLKERSFHEPIVFLDFILVDQVARYPRFYVPYLFPAPVLAVGAAAGLGLVGLWLVEAPVGLSARLWVLGLTVTAGFGAWGGLVWLLGPGGRSRGLALLARLGPTFEAKADFARLGLFASMLGHGIYHAHLRGRAGRPGIVAAAAPAARPATAEPAPHLVLVQAESFFDIRRHLPQAVPADVLAGLDRLRAAGRGGRFLVPTHGAYTMRTEFSVLTGLGPAALGTDAFNPYFTAARQPVPSLAQRLGAAGYATACLHPFYPTFFVRHKVLPNLGFATFESLDAFAGAERAGPYVSDAALGRRILDRLAASTGPAFVFAITIEAHGPWTADRLGGCADAGPGKSDPLSIYLWHLRHMDALFARLAEGLARLPRPSILCGYGDHVAGLPGVGGPGVADPTATDWFLWDSRGNGATDRTLRPEELAGELLAALATA
jgi:hypothetical protein